MTGPLKMAVGVLLAEGQLVMAMMYAMMRERTVRSSKRLCIILLLRELGLAGLDSRATATVSDVSVEKTVTSSCCFRRPGLDRATTDVSIDVNFKFHRTFNFFFDARNTDTQIILMCCYCYVVGILALMVCRTGRPGHNSCLVGSGMP